MGSLTWGTTLSEHRELLDVTQESVERHWLIVAHDPDSDTAELALGNLCINLSDLKRHREPLDVDQEPRSLLSKNTEHCILPHESML